MEDEQTSRCQFCGVELNENSICPVCGESYALKEKVKADIPKRSVLPSTEIGDENSCKVCGYVLSENVETCPMCNSPTITDEETEQEYRCPVCENPLDMNASECPHCMVNLEGKEEERELNYRCPVCQEIMDMRDESCEHCNTRIWLDLDEEIKRIEEYRCPMCGITVQEDSEKCPSCGADIWMRDEDALKEEASNKIEEAQTQIEIESKETRSDLSNAVRFLTVAKEAYEMSDFGRASRCASLSLDLARSAGFQKRILVDALQRAESTLTMVSKKGGDVVKASELLENSKEEVRKGNYRRALKMAIRGKVLAESTMGQEAVLMIDADSLE